MPRIRCNYEGCIHLEGNFCTAGEIELDQELGCLTFSQVEEEVEDVEDELVKIEEEDWEEEEEDLEDEEEEWEDLDEEDDWDDEDEDDDGSGWSSRRSRR